jgi:hypothetical protein
LSSPRPSPQTRSRVPIAKIKQNQANSERGFVLATPVNHSNIKLLNSKKTQKSSKIKPSLSEVFALRHTSSQAIPQQISAKISKVKASLNKVFALRHT